MLNNDDVVASYSHEALKANVCVSSNTVKDRQNICTHHKSKLPNGTGMLHCNINYY